MFISLLSTRQDIAPTIMRVMLGVVMLPHGLQKVFGLFGGHGLDNTLAFFTQNMGIPYALAVMVVAAESLGAVGLIVGFLTRVSAFGVACVMAGAIVMVHFQHGFFMNWFGKQAGEGFEYHLLAVGLAVALMFTGGGRFSLDSLLSKDRY